MALNKYNQEVTWADIRDRLTRQGSEILAALKKGKEVNDRFIVFADGRTPAVIAADLGVDVSYINDAAAAISAMEDLEKIAEGDVGVTITPFLDAIRKFT